MEHIIYERIKYFLIYRAIITFLKNKSTVYEEKNSKNRRLTPDLLCADNTTEHLSVRFASEFIKIFGFGKSSLRA